MDSRKSSLMSDNSSDPPALIGAGDSGPGPPEPVTFDVLHLPGFSSDVVARPGTAVSEHESVLNVLDSRSYVPAGPQFLSPAPAGVVVSEPGPPVYQDEVRLSVSGTKTDSRPGTLHSRVETIFAWPVFLSNLGLSLLIVAWPNLVLCSWILWTVLLGLSVGLSVHRRSRQGVAGCRPTCPVLISRFSLTCRGMPQRRFNISLESDRIYELNTMSMPDVLGLRARAVIHVMTGWDSWSVRALVTDGKVLDRGFHDVTLVDMDHVNRARCPGGRMGYTATDVASAGRLRHVRFAVRAGTTMSRMQTTPSWDSV